MHPSTASETSTSSAAYYGGAKSCTWHVCLGIDVSTARCFPIHMPRHASTHQSLRLTNLRFSLCLKRVDSLRWTVHMQNCLDEIEAHQESTRDAVLVQRVKMQLAAEKCAMSISYDAYTCLDPRYRPPPGSFAQELLTQMHQMTSEIARQTSQDGEYFESLDCCLVKPCMNLTKSLSLQLLSDSNCTLQRWQSPK